MLLLYSLPYREHRESRAGTQGGRAISVSPRSSAACADVARAGALILVGRGPARYEGMDVLCR